MKNTNIPEGYPYNGETCFIMGSTNLKDYLHGGYLDENKDKKASIVLEKLIKKYGIPECGRNRAAFISKNYVIKFPLNQDGEIDNQFESNHKSKNLANGKLIIINNFKCLIQEKLTLIKNKDKLPDWCKEIDSIQVGYNKKNKLRAYDFADMNKENKELTIKKIKF